MSEKHLISEEPLKVGMCELKGRAVYANRTFEVGDIVISAKRESIEPERSNYSIQWDHETHILMDVPARLLNHSCDPNLILRRNANESYDFVAFKRIEIGTELNFDYETTEYIIIYVPECCCGTERCRKSIKGFKFRPDFLKNLYNVNLADYLKA